MLAACSLLRVVSHARGWHSVLGLFETARKEIRGQQHRAWASSDASSPGGERRRPGASSPASVEADAALPGRGTGIPGSSSAPSSSSPPTAAAAYWGSPTSTAPSNGSHMEPGQANGPSYTGRPGSRLVDTLDTFNNSSFPSNSVQGSPSARAASASNVQPNTARIVQTIKGVNIIINLVCSPGKLETKERDLVMVTTAETVQRRDVTNRLKQQEEGPKTPLMGWYRSLKDLMQSTFLPVGYPKTVGEKYIDFVMWQNVGNFSVTASSVLASTFLLYSVGLGDGAIATASALNWVVKDGFGQVGTLVFGKMVAHNFDIHSKTWYFLSQVKLMIAILLEMLTILAPQHFLIMGSIANSFKGLAWMASGSTRSVFNLSYARDNNIADITAKSTSQFIFASLFGTAAGASICTYVEQDFELASFAYVVLAATTCVSAYKTVAVIPLVTLNNARLQLLCERFLECMVTMKEGADKEYPGSGCKDDSMEYDHSFDGELIGMFPTPVSLSAEDPPLPAWLTGDQRFLNPSIVVGSSVEWVVGNSADMMLLLLTTFKSTRSMTIPTTTKIHVVLHENADSKDICQAYLQASLLRRRMRDGADIATGDLANLRIVLQDSLLIAERLTTPFMAACAARGWRTEKIVVEAERRRGHW